jgi:hypothetical protein
LVRSSARPKAKAGIDVAMSIQRARESGAPVTCATTAPTTSAAKTAMPPTRGTGRWWNFCGPERSWSADILACADAERMRTRVMVSAVRKVTTRRAMTSAQPCHGLPQARRSHATPASAVSVRVAGIHSAASLRLDVSLSRSLRRSGLRGGGLLRDGHGRRGCPHRRTA